MSDGMHLAQEQGERANAELHAELERKTWEALTRASTAAGMTYDLFAVLCWNCGVKPSDIFNRKEKQ